MRLSKTEVASIQEAFLKTFQHGEIYLFGSRVHDEKRGGDIDLYIVPATKDNLSHKKIDFLVDLKRLIGDQKIDVVINRGGERPIDRIAKKEGVLLCRH